MNPMKHLSTRVRIVIIAAVLLVMAAGSLLFGRKGKYSR